MVQYIENLFFFSCTQCNKSVLFCYTEFSWNFKLKWHNFENLNHLYFLPDLVLILASRYIWATFIPIIFASILKGQLCIQSFYGDHWQAEEPMWQLPYMY